ncbi:MAG: recombinase family protein [Oscillospiraceae bacterium]|nr:recombinase family protein [Oscillospiraceae bacterium]
MNSKQLAKWRKLYEVMMKITELQPWDIIPEEAPFIYNKREGKEQVFFNVMRQSAAGFGVICYPCFYDYFFFQKRLKSQNMKKQPFMFMDNKFLCMWGDREDVDKENKALIKELGYKFRGKGGWLFFSAVEQRCLPRFLTETEVEFLCDALNNLYSMLKAVCEEGLQVDFEKRYTVFRKCEKNGKWVNSPGKPDFPEEVITKLGESEGIGRIAKMPKGNTVIELGEYCLPVPCQEKGTNICYFPLFITVMDSKTGEKLDSRMLSYRDVREKELFDIIIRLSERLGKIKQIKINDEFTKAALVDFCQKADIKLQFRQKPLKNTDIFMEEVYDEFYRELGGDRLKEGMESKGSRGKR